MYNAIFDAYFVFTSSSKIEPYFRLCFLKSNKWGQGILLLTFSQLNKFEATGNECDVSISMNPVENFLKFSPHHICPHHSQTMEMAAAIIGFAELPEWHLYYDLVLDSLYITDTYHFQLYIFFRRNFVVPLFSPLFDPIAPFLVMPIYMAYPAAPLAAPPTSPPTSSPQVVPILPSESNPYKELASSLSSTSPSTSDDGYTPADPAMVNKFLSSESVDSISLVSSSRCIVWPSFRAFGL